jgi:3',5'-cyclic AMP phosphodiesterase CpdA
MTGVRQLHVIHLSDLHFGEDHRFNIPTMVAGDRPSRPGYPTLFEKLTEDLVDPSPVEHLIFCITGDFATDPSKFYEFSKAEQFVKQIASADAHGRKRGLECVYMVAGNPDVNFGGSSIGERWERYVGFFSRLSGKVLDYNDPMQTVTLEDRTSDLGALILCLNSSAHVQRQLPDAERGEVDFPQLHRIQQCLENFDREKGKEVRENAIRIALIHHHPVLIPDLAESGRGYDAVANSGQLLRKLREYRFHLILHGHKHNPFVFTEDSQSAWNTDTQPIVIVAGGSVGSKGLPDEFQGRTNCYNRITIKWHPAAGQTRINVETRGLDLFRADGREDLPYNWKWRKLREYDKIFPTRSIPASKAYLSVARGPAAPPDEARRVSEYARLRGNLPVVEVMPSLVEGQAYEARAWLVAKPPREMPKQVAWSAGAMHDVVTIGCDSDELFCASFHYWGPMLLQARLSFADGTSETAHLYARIPESHSIRH